MNYKGLKPQQQTIVNNIKTDIKNNKQVMYLIHGAAGAGKTNLCKSLPDKLGGYCCFTATTGTAATLYNGQTINKLLHLGLNKPKVKLPEPKLNRKKREYTLHYLGNNTVLILVDECSMLTPTTLARIDYRLRYIKQFIFSIMKNSSDGPI